MWTWQRDLANVARPLLTEDDVEATLAPPRRIVCSHSAGSATTEAQVVGLNRPGFDGSASSLRRTKKDSAEAISTVRIRAT